MQELLQNSKEEIKFRVMYKVSDDLPRDLSMDCHIFRNTYRMRSFENAPGFLIRARGIYV